MRFFIGIDPGLDGAMALIDDQKNCAVVYDAPTLTVSTRDKDRREYSLSALTNLLAPYARSATECKAAIELVGAMPGQGVTSMFRMGFGLGIWEASLAAFAIPYTRVAPQKWKKAMLVGVGVEKEASRLRAQQLFPYVSLARKKDHGRAEALLIAEYLRRQHKQGKM